MPSVATVAVPSTSAYGRPLAQMAREIGRHLATLHRWRVRGVLDACGVRRRLPMTRVGGRWYVRDSDVAAFFAALAITTDDPAISASTPASRTRSDERALRELDHIGI